MQMKFFEFRFRSRKTVNFKIGILNRQSEERKHSGNSTIKTAS